MKKIVYCVLLGLAIASASCTKKTPETTPVYPDGSKADDANARNEMDKVYSDIETVFNSQDYKDASAQRTSGAILPCGKVTFNTKNFTIDYSQTGVNCGSRVLSGSIDVTLVSGTTFADAGAKLKIVYNDYKVLYNVNKQSITYNGTAYVTNVDGGTFVDLFTATSTVTVTHKVRGQLELTFDSTGTGSANVIREWNVFRKKTYTGNGTATGISLKVEGDTTIDTETYLTIPGAFTEVSEYGISRDGDRFVCDLSTPFVWSNCGASYGGPYVLKQGKVEYTVDLTTNPIHLLGVVKGTWSATAGYRLDGANFVFDGTCDSGGYRLDLAFKNSGGTSLYSTASYQAY
jgi:hypothetical protein